MVWVTCSPTHAPILSDPFPPCAPQTEYACPPKLGLAETRLRPQRGGSMSENDLFFLQAWARPGTAREARAAWRRGVSKPARRNWGTRGQQGGRGRGARGGEEPPARKRPAAASSGARRGATRTERQPKPPPQPLPPGWREEVRVPQSGRKYRVFIGSGPGQYAESRSKAWEAYERLNRPRSSDDDDPSSRKRGRAGRRVCLACDMGRKRKCTCGKRARRW